MIKELGKRIMKWFIEIFTGINPYTYIVIAYLIVLSGFSSRLIVKMGENEFYTFLVVSTLLLIFLVRSFQKYIKKVRHRLILVKGNISHKFV